jgi:hypothetical protein
MMSCPESQERHRLPPEIPIQRAVLDHLGDVLGADGLRFREIGDGAGDFQDAVAGAVAAQKMGARAYV